MKSKRSLVRAILFVLRLQKSVSARNRESQRVITRPNLQLVRCESTKHRRRSSHKCAQRHRNSAPSSSFPLRSPNITNKVQSKQYNQAEKVADFGAFTGLSQPYSMGLDDSRGRPLISVCAGAAHTLASTALLGRQKSLDEMATRALEKVAVGPLLRGVSVQRQESIDDTERKKNDELDLRLQRKAIRTNMITMYGALLVVEQNDSDALRMILEKQQFDVNSPISTGPYQHYSTVWTLLDVAVNCDHIECARLLQQHHAIENFQMNNIEKRKRALDEALLISGKELDNLRQSPHAKETDKEISQLIAHIGVLREMSNNLEIPSKPEPLATAKVEAISNSKVAIYVSPPSETSLVLKYKIEWSVYPSFDTIFGQCYKPVNMENVIIVDELENDLTLIFRVSQCGLAEFSAPVVCSPGMIEISTWRDIEGKKEDWLERSREIELLTDDIDKHRQGLVWQHIFSMESRSKKRKNGLKELFTASSKFSKHATRGVYLASLVYTEGKALCTVDDCLPIMEIDENVTTISKDDHHWLMKMSLCWEQVDGLLNTSQSAYSNNVSLSFRSKLINAAISMQHALGISDIGRLHYIPITHENCVFLFTLRFVDSCQHLQGLTLRWLTFEKLLRKKMSTPAIENLTKETVNILNFFESSQIPLKRGLYLCYLKLHSSLNSARVVVPDNLPSMLPFVHVRDNPHVTKEEWKWIKSIDVNEDFQATNAQISLHKLLLSAISTLLHDLDIDNDLVPGHRLYHTDIIQPNANVSIILVLPRPNDVCSAPTGSAKNTDFLEQRRGCSSIPIPVFEMIHFGTYQPKFIAMYCRLSIFLEHFLMICQYEQRKCLLEHDAKVYKMQCETLVDYQKRLDDIWQSARWISRIAMEARDKHIKVSRKTVPLGRLLASLCDDDGEDASGYQPRTVAMSVEYCLKNSLSARVKATCNSMFTFDPGLYSVRRRKAIEILTSAQTGESVNDPNHCSLYRRRKVSMDANAAGRQLLNPEKNLIPDRPAVRGDRSCQTTVHVCVAYDCWLPKGTRIDLAISENTSAQEIVGLVLEQVAKSSEERATDVPDTSSFCLVSNIGNRERRFKDETSPLKIQDHWARGSLFVRKREDFLAAVEYGNESVV